MKGKLNKKKKKEKRKKKEKTIEERNVVISLVLRY